MDSMATGTPRPALLQEKSSKEVLKTWTSFDESPVHAGNKYTILASACHVEQ